MAGASLGAESSQGMTVQPTRQEKRPSAPGSRRQQGRVARKPGQPARPFRRAPLARARGDDVTPSWGLRSSRKARAAVLGSGST